MASADATAERTGAVTAGDNRLIDVEVVWSPAPRQLHTRHLRVPVDCRVDEALRLSGLLDGLEAAEAQALSVSVWGRLQPGDHPLRQRDRIELCRPLTVDPKEARRLRYRGQRAGKAAKATPAGA